MDRGDPDCGTITRVLANARRMRIPRRSLLRQRVGAVAAIALAACAEPPTLGSGIGAATVGDYETSTCTTAVVLELSRQIAAEVGCLVPGELVPFAEGNGVRFVGAAVLPYASEDGRADLLAAVAAGGGTTLDLTSAYRTVAQQYLLYRWYQLGRCGIPVAATPGTSNHESGRAIDVDNWEDWLTVLPAHGWAHDVPGDDVHFDHLASPDLRGTDVLAFQRLWNRNHPAAAIDEDGAYGPMTAMALAMAPAEGFAIGASCVAAGLAVELVAIEMPEYVPSGEAFDVTITVRNAGAEAWPTGAALVTAEPLGRASVLAGPGWIAADRPAAVTDAIAAGGYATFRFTAVAPVVEDPTELLETFTLAIGDEHAGAVALRVRVEFGGGDVGGCGCASGGAADPRSLGLVALVGVGLGRRRRRR